MFPALAIGIGVLVAALGFWQVYRPYALDRFRLWEASGMNREHVGGGVRRFYAVMAVCFGVLFVGLGLFDLISS